MRKLPVATMLTFALLACADASSDNGTFDAFWAQFKDAVEENDASAVRELTRFPFMYENRERASAEFAEVYAALFDEKARRCLSASRPVEEDGGYMVFCGAIIYVFGQEAGQWRFTEFAADPEAIMEGGS